MMNRSTGISSLAVLAVACGNTAEPARGEAVATQHETLGPSCLTASETSGWLTQAFSTAGNRYKISLDAKTGSDESDALFGLSNGAADQYSDLAAIVRFNPAGEIDARNGAGYDAESVVPYRAGQPHHFEFDVDVENHRYSVDEWIGPYGYRIANGYAFRTEQAGVGFLNSFALKTDEGGPFEVCNVNFHFPGACYVAGANAGFANYVFSPQATALTVSFRVVPDAAGIDGVVGLSSGPAGAFNDIAAAVRFNENGFVDARNGDRYEAADIVPYAPNFASEVTLIVDVLGHAYSAIVDGRHVARNYAFRSQQASVASLGHVGFIADSAVGGFRVCDILVSPAQGVASLHHAPLGPDPSAQITDAAGNRYVADTFTRTFDAGGGPLVSAGGTDVYLAKYAPGGAHLWSRRFGGPDDDNSSPPAVNAAGEVALRVEEEIVRLDTDGTERFRRATPSGSPIALDAAGNLVAAERSPEPGFTVTKLDPSGTTLWVKQVRALEGGATTEHITTDADGNVLFAGGINGSIDVGVVITRRSSEGDMQTFVVKLDPNGGLVYGFGWELNLARGITVDGAGNLTVAGYDYNPDAMRLASFDPSGAVVRQVAARQLVHPIALGVGGPPRADAEGYVSWPIWPRIGNSGVPLVARLEPLP